MNILANSEILIDVSFQNSAFAEYLESIFRFPPPQE
jgi:hypothetical protein